MGPTTITSDSDATTAATVQGFSFPRVVAAQESRKRKNKPYQLVQTGRGNSKHQRR